MSIFTPSTNFSKVSKILLSLLAALIFHTGSAFAQDAPFITVWQTDNPGISNDNQITIPGTGTDYLIEWEEVGNEANNNGSETGTDEHTITFPSAGTYRVKISGDFTRVEFNNQGDKDKILDIEQWGDIQWVSFKNAFFGCSNFDITATDTPNLSSVTNMSRMFSRALNFNGSIGHWDVSNVTNMSFMFTDASSFNQELNNWDVSKVNKMYWMFGNCFSFNKDLNSWDVSKVTNMYAMFLNDTLFNGNITSWDLTNAVDLGNMFDGASSFNRDLNNWNVSKVRNMNYMFRNASKFNGNVSTWDVSSVINMSQMFIEATSFNGDLSNWDVSNVTAMYRMFEHASKFNSDLSNWDISSVTDMNSMFKGAIIFNSDLSNWDVSSVTDMRSTFFEASSFNSNLSNWDVSKVTSMSSMFNAANSFNGDLSNWDVSSVTNMGSMFFEASSFNSNLSNWDVSSVTNMGSMFEAAISFNGDISKWNVSNVQSMSFMFAGAVIFDGDIADWNVSAVRFMNTMFRGASSFNNDISSWNVSLVTDMGSMFAGASSFNGNLKSWDVSSVRDMGAMFRGANSFNNDICAWDVSSVEDMNYMFKNAPAFNMDIGNWNVSEVTSMLEMFANASSFNQSLDKWSISKVLNLSYLFDNTALSIINYDRTLIGWSKLDNLNSNLILGSGGLGYCLSSSARNYLTNVKGWTISGDSENCQSAFISSWDSDNQGESESNQVTIPANGGDYLVFWEDLNNTAINGLNSANGYHTMNFPEPGNYRIKIFGELTSINFSDLGDKLKITEIENWGDIQWNNFNASFAGAENLHITANDAPDLSQVTDMTRMFYNAKSLNQDISHWDVSTVTNMSDLFHGASSFNQDLSDWDVSNVTKMTRMFANTAAFNQDLNNWNTANVDEMDFMFWEADAFQGNISEWNTSTVTNMWGMFYGADAFNTDISIWDVSSVTNMTEMFREAAAFKQDINDWNVANVTDISGMFYDAISFDQNLGDWDLSNASSLFEFLTNSGLSATNYDLSLEGWATNGNIPSNIALSAEGLFYCASAEYRQQLIDDYGWKIIGDETCSLVMEETLPAAEATSVEKDTEIYLTFDQEIEEIDFSGITLKDVNGNLISLTDVYIDSLTLHLVHSGLGSNTYEVLIPESSIISITAKENDAISWSFTTQRILSSEEQQKLIGHSAFPNPFSDFTTIQFNLPQSQSFNLFIFDLKGQMVRQEKYENLGSDKQSIRFERKDLPAGLYNYQIQSADGSVGGKMLIQ